MPRKHTQIDTNWHVVIPMARGVNQNLVYFVMALMVAENSSTPVASDCQT
jgi:hypothetical protein